MNEQQAPFQRGEGDWAGVVMIIRPDVTRMPLGAEPMCNVQSARTVQLGGRRAINCMLPYAMVEHFFQAGDGDHVFAEAEFKVGENGSGHLEFYSRSRATLKDWVLYSMNEEQARGAALN